MCVFFLIVKFKCAIIYVVLQKFAKIIRALCTFDFVSNFSQNKILKNYTKISLKEPINYLKHENEKDHCMYRIN